MDKKQYIDIAKEVLKIEINGLEEVSSRIDHGFVDALNAIYSCKGKVIICGMGKSGIIGKKIAATLASTGTQSFFIHPGEAYHGDLGMIDKGDIFLAISNSGETSEVVKLVPFLKENENYLISVTGNKKSFLALSSDAHLDISISKEACPHNLAPTTSTTATLAMGDALAVALMKRRNFKPENFARFHPGGSLGKKLLSKVEDEMVKDDLPLVEKDSDILKILDVMTRGNLGLAIVKHQKNYGIITDGDLRRSLEKNGKKIFDLKASDLSKKEAIHVKLGTRVEDALTKMKQFNITSLLIMNGEELLGVFKK